MPVFIAQSTDACGVCRNFTSFGQACLVADEREPGTAEADVRLVGYKNPEQGEAKKCAKNHADRPANQAPAALTMPSQSLRPDLDILSSH